jgi:hypothetical protein
MQIIGRRAARATGWTSAAILIVAMLAGLVRVLPWIVAPTIPMRVVVPFARALFAASLETTLLCAPPIGWALASAWLVDRGEARALFAIGQSPARIVATSLPVALAFAALAGVAALAWGTEAAAPGRLARSLVEQSKRSCAAQPSPAINDVPFVGVTWLCFGRASQAGGPRLAGALPGASGAFTAADMTVSDDLRSLEFRDMRLLFGEATAVRVHAAEARIQGLSPWGRASNVRPGMRALLLSFTGAALALLASWSVLTGFIARRLASLLIGAAGPLAAVLVFSRLERTTHGVASYLAVPAAGLCGWAAGVLVVHAKARLANIAR